MIPATIFSLKSTSPFRITALIKKEATTVKTVKRKILIFKELFKKNNKSVYESLMNENIDISNTNYFETGLIDSFGIMTLIMEIEQKYSITLNEKHFGQRRFSTIF